MKKTAPIQGIVLSLFLFSLPVFAQVENAQARRQATEEEGPEEAGNKICPVSGEKIKEAEAYKVEYKGKIYQ